MSEIVFYQMRGGDENRLLPPLLEKILARKLRAVIRLPDEESAAAMNRHLWVWRDESFLPHGGAGDANSEQQPVYLTCAAENPAQAQVLILLGGAEAFNLAGFKQCLYFFDGSQSEQQTGAEQKAQIWQGENHSVKWWQAKSSGGWEPRPEKPQAQET